METNQNSMQNIQMPIPNSTSVLVLGILSIIGCSCYGFVGLILGIIAVVLAAKGKKIYKANPSAFTIGSFSNLNAGNVCGIIGICLSALMLIYIIFMLALLGPEIFSGDPSTIMDRLDDL